nr:class II glutamine amidotransferase [Pseudomonas peli]
MARFYRPVGDTDSEAAFCDLLNRVREAFPRAGAGGTACCRCWSRLCRLP